MNKYIQHCVKPVYALLSGGLLFISLFFVQAFLNVSHADEVTPLATNPIQVAWWGPYPRDYYYRHYWSGWRAVPGYSCQQRCFHNRYTGAIVRCERICN